MPGSAEADSIRLPEDRKASLHPPATQEENAGAEQFSVIPCCFILKDTGTLGEHFQNRDLWCSSSVVAWPPWNSTTYRTGCARRYRLERHIQQMMPSDEAVGIMGFRLDLPFIRQILFKVMGQSSALYVKQAQ